MQIEVTRRTECVMVERITVNMPDEFDPDDWDDDDLDQMFHRHVISVQIETKQAVWPEFEVAEL